ncbi:MAG TPA: hypothetical protein VN699_13685 [Pirellulales bacterium]|nr:hypothetical protein [Pirellulales bacterium]
MKLAMSALFAFALLAGPSGCCLFSCGPLSQGCAGFDDGGCDGGGCDVGGCGGGCGCEADGYPATRGCMGCSRRLHIFNWSRCCDSCDQCGNWTGAGFVSQKGGWPGRQYAAAPASADEAAPEMEMTTTGEAPREQIVPGSMKVTTRDVEPAPAEDAAGPSAARRPKTVSAPRPAKRISSSKK